VPDSGNRRVLVRGTHRELVAIEFAQVHGAFAREVGHHGGVERRPVIAQHARAGSGREVLGDKNVLVRQRHAFQRSAVAGGQTLVGRARLRQGDGFVPCQIDAQGVMGFGTRQKVLCGLGRGHLAQAQVPGQFDQAQVM
jgi:hypothetical protein